MKHLYSFSTYLQFHFFIFVMCLFSIMNMSHAQQYFPMPTEYARWRAVTQAYDLSTIVYTQIDQFVIHGDTVLDSLTYAKIYRANNDSIIDSSSFVYMGALREDSTKKVYYRGLIPSRYVCDSIYAEDEILLCDFSLQVGDTVSLWEDSTKMAVTHINNIMIGGVNRNQWHLQNVNISGAAPDNDTWVEGIGSMKGLLYGHCLEFEWGYYLACFEDSLIFHDFTGSCFTVGEQEQFEEKTYKIYPNPSSGRLNFEVDKSAISIEIVDYSGRSKLLEAIKPEHNQKGSLDISFLSSGLYMVLFRTEQGVSGISKLVVE